MSFSQNNYRPNPDHVVFLGESGFPVGLATIQRITLIGKALISVGVKTTVICRKGVWDEKSRNFEEKGSFEGINYIYTSKKTFRPKEFINRNIQKIKGIYGEFMYLRYLKKHDEISMAIVSEMSIIHVIRYYIFSIALKFPIVINFTEMSSSMQHRLTFFNRINDHFHDRWVIKLYDGAFAISANLLNYYKKISPSKPLIKLPILCDFNKFDQPKSEKEVSYFLYCGSMGYKEIINFILSAFQTLTDFNDVELFMIVSGGTKREVILLEEKINDMFDNKPIRLFSNIPYEQLVSLYINAKALLIPLRPTIQDASRFPHKIGEYLASGNPVITTAIGEINTYFEDGKTALIAENYEVDLFAEKMRFVLENPQKAKQIGQKGKELGLREFHYQTHGVRIQNFLKELQKQS
ncbi:glycosyltransferase [Pareuzebyella sediminis]|uniref:glycosyltransferase n=1 Tax=Pareuzebyella sediminis TaxID=2607998 RepID=UPI0011EE4A19|nr:glycosyltransferase [Pareuzebyella sediminis]